ncbi:MAG: hypothetical protein JOZ69_25215 [Myxococcales bacterium]|nr:hypothetical protein [Myxococcales bacterium]
MFDRDAPSTKRVFEELEDDELRNGLYCFARWQTWSAADAEDLVAEALMRVCDPEDKPWSRRGARSSGTCGT